MLQAIQIPCLLSGSECSYFVVSDLMPMHQCLSMSQVVAAKWTDTYPLHKISRILCSDPRRVPVYLGRSDV